MIQFIAFTLAAATPVAEPAAPQDFLTPHLEAKRHDNMRRHQMRLAKRRAALRGETRTPVASRKVTLMERQSAWNANKSEYRKRMLRDGPASADRWLDSLVIAGRK